MLPPLVFPGQTLAGASKTKGRKSFVTCLQIATTAATASKFAATKIRHQTQRERQPELTEAG